MNLSWWRNGAQKIFPRREIYLAEPRRQVGPGEHSSQEKEEANSINRHIKISKLQSP